MTAPLLDAVREFTTTILNPYDLSALLHRLTDRATVITRAEGAGIMLAGPEGLAFAAASNDEVVEAEMTQDRVDEGPCQTAYEHDTRTVVVDLAEEARWPGYRGRPLELGLRAIVALPMRACGQTIGVLDVYRKAPGPWSDEDLDALEILTAMASGYILHANQLRGQHDLTDQLHEALQTRDLIGQAKGVLMAQHGIDADEAFQMLREVSQRSNTKLRDVATRIIERVQVS